MNEPEDSSFMDDLTKIFEAQRAEDKVVVVYENLERVYAISNDEHMFFVRSTTLH